MADSLRKQILKETASNLASRPAIQKEVNEPAPEMESVLVTPNRPAEQTTISEDQTIPTNSAPALENHSSDWCKNGATSVQPLTESLTGVVNF